ncbi:hypothetical protein Tco_0607770 [Tanacetum coccineum]
MAWVKWPIILNSFDKGGLNIGSLKAFNLALLQKWRWRMFSSPNDLSVKVVKAFHGHEGGFDNIGCSFKGIWANIVGSSNFLHSKGIILSNSFRFKAGCGTRIRFWKDIWVPKIFSSFRDMLNEIGQVNIEVSEDTCVWSLGPKGTFTVKDARNLIDQKSLPSLPSTTWEKSIPHGLISPLSKLYHLRHSKIGSPLGMLLNIRNTSFTLSLHRFFGGFGDSKIVLLLTLSR